MMLNLERRTAIRIWDNRDLARQFLALAKS